MDIIIYVMINAFLIVFAVLTFKFWSGLGAFGGLIGSLFAYMVFVDPEIVFNSTYTAEGFVYQSVEMGFFAFIPLILAIMNFVLVLKKK